MSWLSDLVSDYGARLESVRASLGERVQVISGRAIDVSTSSVPTPTPLSVPLDELRQTVTVSRDFRDVYKWARVREYDPKVYGWPRNKKRGQARGVIDWRDLSTIVLHTAGGLCL